MRVNVYQLNSVKLMPGLNKKNYKECLHILRSPNQIQLPDYISFCIWLLPVH